jgi:hypothetical protein
MPSDLFSGLSDVKSETNNPAKANMSIIDAPAQCIVLKKIPAVASTSMSPLKIDFDFMINLFWGSCCVTIQVIVLLPSEKREFNPLNFVYTIRLFIFHTFSLSLVHAKSLQNTLLRYPPMPCRFLQEGKRIPQQPHSTEC